MKKRLVRQRIALFAMAGIMVFMTGCGNGASGETAEDAVAEKAPEEVQQVLDGDWTAEDETTLRYAFNKDFGGTAGVCLPAAALDDPARMDLVTGNFNSVTMENEMKPESFLGQTPNIGEDGFPILDFTTADRMLDVIKEYNSTCDMAEKQIRVRGHVLVWHSQTPEWFFHEDYDVSKGFVSSDVMLTRMENYIGQVLTHFHGEDSPYKGMIYAWDVVNEAVGDADGNIRAGDSPWFTVFKTNEYIIQAFVYANKYAPADVKLFYNDYNDTNATKCKGICELIEDIKENPEARIDGMGMQGHYDMNFSASEFETAVRAYAEVVDEVQITELDLKSSGDYDGSDVNAEYQKQAWVYKSLYDVVVRLVQEENLPITSVVFWGTDDGHSWLQTSNSVGGSADGSRPQCPVLFDAEYNAKPAYWAFVDASQLEPYIQEIVALETDDHTVAQKVAFKADKMTLEFAPVWGEDGICVEVFVNDKTEEEGDQVTLYLDMADSRKEGADITAITVKRSECDSKANGYTAEIFVEATELEAFSTVGIDLCVKDGDKIISWNDSKNTQDTSSKYYGKMVLKPFTTISKGSVSVDGQLDSAWDQAKVIPLDVVTAEGGTPEATVFGKALWDEEALYVWMEVTDPNMDVTGSEVHTQDSVEVFVDEKNEKSESYDGNDKQYRVNCENVQSFNGSSCVAENITSEVVKTADGYVVEMAIKWTAIEPAAGTAIGFELQINDCKGGGRLGMVNWFDRTNTCYANPSSYGTAVLVDSAE